MRKNEPAKRWRIEKIHARHPAHLNDPNAFPVGWWFATNDPDETEMGSTWVEFCALTWDSAMRRVEKL